MPAAREGRPTWSARSRRLESRQGRWWSVRGIAGRQGGLWGGPRRAAPQVESLARGWFSAPPASSPPRACPVFRIDRRICSGGQPVQTAATLAADLRPTEPERCSRRPRRQASPWGMQLPCADRQAPQTSARAAHQDAMLCNCQTCPAAGRPLAQLLLAVRPPAGRRSSSTLPQCGWAAGAGARCWAPPPRRCLLACGNRRPCTGPATHAACLLLPTCLPQPCRPSSSPPWWCCSALPPWRPPSTVRAAEGGAPGAKLGGLSRLAVPYGCARSRPAVTRAPALLPSPPLRSLPHLVRPQAGLHVRQLKGARQHGQRRGAAVHRPGAL